jgi:hypothetical protein
MAQPGAWQGYNMLNEGQICVAVSEGERKLMRDSLYYDGGAIER